MACNSVAGADTLGAPTESVEGGIESNSEGTSDGRSEGKNRSEVGPAVGTIDGVDGTELGAVEIVVEPSDVGVIDVTKDKDVGLVDKGSVLGGFESCVIGVIEGRTDGET